MSGKYAFTKSLKEVRFLFCQTSEHSAAVRYVCEPNLAVKKIPITCRNPNNLWQILPHESLPDNEEEQPSHSHHDPRGAGNHAQDIRSIRYGTTITRAQFPMQLGEDHGAELTLMTDFGNEKAQSLEGLTDKQVEEAVTGMVKSEA